MSIWTTNLEDFNKKKDKLKLSKNLPTDWIPNRTNLINNFKLFATFKIETAISIG